MGLGQMSGSPLATLGSLVVQLAKPVLSLCLPPPPSPAAQSCSFLCLCSVIGGSLYSLFLLVIFIGSGMEWSQCADSVCHVQPEPLATLLPSGSFKPIPCHSRSRERVSDVPFGRHLLCTYCVQALRISGVPEVGTACGRRRRWVRPH